MLSATPGLFPGTVFFCSLGPPGTTVKYARVRELQGRRVFPSVNLELGPACTHVGRTPNASRRRHAQWSRSPNACKKRMEIGRPMDYLDHCTVVQAIEGLQNANFRPHPRVVFAIGFSKLNVMATPSAERLLRRYESLFHFFKFHFSCHVLVHMF